MGQKALDSNTTLVNVKSNNDVSYCFSIKYSNTTLVNVKLDACILTGLK